MRHLCVSWTILGQPGNSIFSSSAFCRVYSWDKQPFSFVRGQPSSGYHRKDTDQCNCVSRHFLLQAPGSALGFLELVVQFWKGWKSQRGPGIEPRRGSGGKATQSWRNIAHCTRWESILCVTQSHVMPKRRNGYITCDERGGGENYC